MSVQDRAVLRVGRARWYEETRLLTAAGIVTVFPGDVKDGAHGEE